MGILDLIYPKKCLECGAYGTYICSRCLILVPAAWGRCVACRKATLLGRTHIECQAKTPLDGVLSIWAYDLVIKKAILALKYKFATDITGELAEKATEKLNILQILPPKAILVPVPLFRSRERWRGFNQTATVGEVIARKIGWQYHPEYLKRVVRTQVQASLGIKERYKNVKDAFQATENFDQNTPILIFDDVLTTGNTLSQAAAAVRRQGAKHIWGLTIAA